MVSDENTLSAWLLCRGILIKVAGDQIYLTDNAFLGNVAGDDRRRDAPSDAAVLSAILRKIDCSGLITTAEPRRPLRPSVPDRPLSSRQKSALFESAAIHEEAGYDLWKASLRAFRAHATGPKVPLAWLEPHVALLVKALNAAGCRSSSCCEGHLGQGELHVELVGAVHAPGCVT